MENDLISRQAAIDALKGLPTWWADSGGYYGGAQPPMEALLEPEDAISALENLPSAEPESAQWVQMLINPNLYKCSNCQIAWNKRLVFENEGYSNNILMRYCPRCGRKMKTEVDYE